MTDHHLPTSPARGSPPTARQQRYLRSLAMERGVSFTVPRTRAEASRLIGELRRRPVDSAPDRRHDVRAVQDAIATGRGDAARVREELEVTGYGANCRWSHLVHDE